MQSAEIVRALFEERLSLKPVQDASAALVAIGILVEKLKFSLGQCRTVQETLDNITPLVTAMLLSDKADMSVRNACELLLRFITLSSFERPDFYENIVERAVHFDEYANKARSLLARNAVSFLTRRFLLNSSPLNCHTGSTSTFCVLIFGLSRAVLASVEGLLLARGSPTLHCLVAGCTDDEWRHLEAWSRPHLQLTSHTLLRPSRLQLVRLSPNCLSLALQRADCVLLGAEAFCQSGGVVNRLGSCDVAVLASHFRVPVFALLEFFKFSRCSAGETGDLPLDCLFKASQLAAHRGQLMDDGGDGMSLLERPPLVDYTPHHLIEMVITDRSVTPPEIATVDIIKLYV